MGMERQMSGLRWFGKKGTARLYEWSEEVPAPPRTRCLNCEEPIEPGDDGFIDAGGSVFHRECWLRMIFGSLAHQARLCSCHNNLQRTELEQALDELPRRLEAKLAVAYYESGKHLLQ